MSGVRQRAAMLPDGRRLHLQDGPIDLVIEAVGPGDAVRAAYAAAAARFAGVLDELCAELPALRRPAEVSSPGSARDAGDGRAFPLPGGEGQGEGRDLSGGLTPLTLACGSTSPPGRGDAYGRFASPIARRMHAAVLPYAADGFITPMAAVAGAVAEEILLAMRAAAPLERASVNNGGDIALHLAPGTSTVVGLVDRPDWAGPNGRPGLFGRATLRAEGPVRGIATSGAGGRSFSLGIADAVTVLARTAAGADAAATVVANAADLPDHPGILRVPATSLQPDSDLGGRLVTRRVPPLHRDAIAEALGRGEAAARRLVARGLICACALHLQGVTTLVGDLMEIAADRGPALAAPPATRPPLGGGYAHVRANA